MKLIILAKSLDEKSKEDLIKDYIELYKENEKLKRKLRKYDNPNTPSSKKGFDKPQAQGIPVGRKAGKNYKHHRTTRPADIPNTPPITVTAEINPSNGSKNIIETGYYIDRVITDIKIEKIVTKYKILEYEDLDTHDVFFAKHPNLPEKGIFGKNIIAFANSLHFDHRVTIESVRDIFTNVANISMSAPTVLELCNRGVEKTESLYSKINEDIKNSDIVNADETGSNQNGKSEWLWGFFTATQAYFVFFQKRGGEIVEKVLGKNFKGILGCDGWITYKIFSETHGVLLQRCWAHLIREVKSICKDVKYLNEAYVWIYDMFKEIQRLRKIKSKSIRKKGYDNLIADLNMWIKTYYSRDGMKELVKKILNGQESWFTCVLHPNVEPTNNRAERGLRKFVVIEKIIGCLRSEQGKRRYQVMLSAFATWRLQGLNPYKELRAIL